MLPNLEALIWKKIQYGNEEESSTDLQDSNKNTSIPRGKWTVSFSHVKSKLYAFGGRNESEVDNDLHSFDLGRNLNDRPHLSESYSWGYVKAIGDIPSPRGAASLTAIQDDVHLLLFGGEDMILNLLNRRWR